MPDEKPTPSPAAPTAPAKPDYNSYVGKTSNGGVTVKQFIPGYVFPSLQRAKEVPAFLVTTDHERIQRYVPADVFLTTNKFN
jgi:hypothetical protein